MHPSIVPGLVFILLGWLVFTWLPGYIHSRTFGRSDAEVKKIVREAEHRSEPM